MCATPGETGGWRRRMTADAAATHMGAWSISSVPAKEEEREADIEDLGEENDRARESPDQPPGTGLALSGPFPRASRGGWFGPDHAQCGAVARSSAEPAAQQRVFPARTLLSPIRTPRFAVLTVDEHPTRRPETAGIGGKMTDIRHTCRPRSIALSSNRDIAA